VKIPISCPTTRPNARVLCLLTTKATCYGKMV